MFTRNRGKLICLVILLTIFQIAACFRIKYEPVKIDEANSSATKIHETQTPTENKEVEIKLEDDINNISEQMKLDSIINSEKFESKTSSEKDKSEIQLPIDMFKGFGRNPALRKLIENEDPQFYEKIIDIMNVSKSTDNKKMSSKDYAESAGDIKSENKVETNIYPKNNYSVKQSPVDIFKGFGRNPAIRKLVENEDPQLVEKIVNYMKTSQLEIDEKVSPSLNSEDKDMKKNQGSFESDKSKSDVMIERKLKQPDSTKPLIVTSKTNEKLPDLDNLQSTEQKEKSKIVNSNKQAPSVEETSKYLNADTLVYMTASSGKGEAQSIECDLPHLDINSRCFANVMEVTVTSRSALLGRISFQEAQGHIDISGNNVVFYAVYGIRSTSGFMWQLQEHVTADDVDVDCQTCHTLDLRMMILVMEEFKDKNKRCIVDLTCKQPNMPDKPRLVESLQIEMPQDSKTAESSISRVHAAKTTLNLLKGSYIDSEVLPQDHVAIELGSKLGLSISAYTKDITLDLHILQCEARGEDGKGIALIKDGCSAHHAVNEFHEVLGMIHDPDVDDHHIVKVTQYTTFQVFNFSPKPQAIAIICKIKMCGGECDEQPKCVNSEVNLGHRKQKSFTIFYEEVVLGQLLNVAGLPDFRGAPKNLDFLSYIIEPDEEAIKSLKEQELDIHANCVPRLVFYISLCVLGGLFLLLLVLGLYFSKAIVIPRMSSYKINMDEVESPSRALYHEYSSPRRRSPGSKTPEQQSMLNKIVYN